MHCLRSVDAENLTDRAGVDYTSAAGSIPQRSALNVHRRRRASSSYAWGSAAASSKPSN